MEMELSSDLAKFEYEEAARKSHQEMMGNKNNSDVVKQQSLGGRMYLLTAQNDEM